MNHKAMVLCCGNQKGGVGKTFTAENLGIGLAREGKKVLLVDMDPQASLTISLGFPRPDELPVTISDMMQKVIMDKEIQPGEGILSHPEGVDLMPASIDLSGLEVSLVNAMSRESVLKQYLEPLKKVYDYIILDCMPSLGMLTINALAASDHLIVPVQAQYLSAKGLEQLLQTVNKVKRQINPKLKIEGILLTMVDARTNNSKEITGLIRKAYGSRLKVFDIEIPRSVRAAEISAEGKSIFAHDPGGKVASAYRQLTKEVIRDTEKRRKLFLSKRAAASFGHYADAQLRRLQNAIARDTLPQSSREEHIRKSVNHALNDFNRRQQDEYKTNVSLYIDTAETEGLETEIFLDANFHHYPLRRYNDMMNTLHTVVRDYDKIGKRNHKKDDNHLNKHAMHLVRLFMMGIDILERDDIRTHRPETDLELLRSIRNGDYMQENILTPAFYEIVTDYEQRFHEAEAHSILPDNPDMKAVGAFVEGINRRVVTGEIG